MAPSNPYDIDAWTNPYTPRPPFRHLPAPVARFFGYRSPSSSPQQPHTLVVWACSFLGAFLGVSLLEGVYLNLPALSGHTVPTIIASFGASAILSYNTIETPLAQPRNLVFGHFLSALIGTCITKLFHLLPYAEFNKLRWLAGSLSVGVASVVMGMTKTVHPPAGATALLCATTVEITELGWWFLPLVLLGCMLMLTSALIINNVARRYPVYWWTPADLDKAKADRKAGDVETASQAKKEEEEKTKKQEDEKLRSLSQTDSDSATRSETSGRTPGENLLLSRKHQIMIEGDRIVVPDWMHTDEWELSILETLRQRVRNGPPDTATTRQEP
ncbi:uncharacterized protein HMPREF1541_08047 [Cyphellophora europaea CBS 101466]|uniref:HPP transmembrane region domain-containing protein n=1 Tax=Cyphellophora europaea (strain CBS 101466) TaxID=1220924 RepID=W2RKN9_CYPE1|nr:uncharacterized protein HMPREF1541_08047 [Cyphellophora europaea CBS 101466]ETN37057.1 hypothetical protein HMPREF1541_08047 [Cyphellophora europaea CBS 101466]